MTKDKTHAFHSIDPILNQPLPSNLSSNTLAHTILYALIQVEMAYLIEY